MHFNFLNEDGDVKFNESDTKGWPKRYVFEGEKENKDLSITYMLYEDWVEIVDFDFPHKKCETNLSNKVKTVVPIPRSEMTSIIEAQEMRILETARCKMKCYGLKDDDVKKFHLNADVIMSESEPKLEPNPYYTLEGKIGNTTYKFIYIIGEARTRINDIIGDKKCDC